jgi:hypothetical protein
MKHLIKAIRFSNPLALHKLRNPLTLPIFHRFYQKKSKPKAKRPGHKPTQAEMLLRVAVKPTATVEEKLIGYLLGDAHIAPSRQSKGGPQIAAMSFTHGQKQAVYLKYKWRLFKQFRQMAIYNSTNKYGYTAGKFYTVGFPYFAELASKWYGTWTNPSTGESFRVKRVPPLLVYDSLTAVSLGAWFGDDGSKNRASAFKLSTGDMVFSSLVLLRGVLFDKFGIITTCPFHSFTIGKKGLPLYLIYVVSESIGVFQKTVEPFLHKSLHYKLIFPYGGHSGVYAHPSKRRPVSPKGRAKKKLVDPPILIVWLKGQTPRSTINSFLEIDLIVWDGARKYKSPEKPRKGASPLTLQLYYQKLREKELKVVRKGLAEWRFGWSYVLLVDFLDLYLNQIAFFYYCSARDAQSTGQLALSNRLFEKAADYWKEAIRLAPSDYWAAKNWLKKRSLIPVLPQQISDSSPPPADL